MQRNDLERRAAKRPRRTRRSRPFRAGRPARRPDRAAARSTARTTRADQAVGVREIRLGLEIPDVDRKRASLRRDVGGPDVFGDARSVERRRHHDEAWARLRRREEREQEIELEAPLVELVEHEHVEGAGERRRSQDHAGRREDDPRRVARDGLVAHRVADPFSEPRSLRAPPRAPRGFGTRRVAARRRARVRTLRRPSAAPRSTCPSRSATRRPRAPARAPLRARGAPHGSAGREASRSAV